MCGTKKCTKCGIEKSVEGFNREKNGKFGVRAICKVCQAGRDAEYRSKNTDKIAERQAEYYSKNKEKIAERNAEYRTKNKEKIAERDAKYYAKNKEKKAKHNAEYKTTEQGKIAMTRGSQKYRSKLNNLPFSWTEADIRFCLDYWNNSCVNCGAIFDDSVKLHWDHYVPISRSDCPGTIPRNLLCLCQHCNQSKNKKLPQNFFDEKTLNKIELYFSLLEDRTEAMAISDELDLMVAKLLH